MTTDQKDAIDNMLGKIAEMSAFINDIAKLLGEDDLGKDGKTWSIEDFENAINELQAKDNSWISVEDRLPPEWELVLIYNKKYGTGGFKIASYNGYKDYYGNPQFSDRKVMREATHWMPLPKPPTTNQ